MAPSLGQKRAMLPHYVFVEAPNSQINKLAGLAAKKQVAATIVAEAAIIAWSCLIGAEG
jgi:hypothetical protein